MIYLSYNKSLNICKTLQNYSQDINYYKTVKKSSQKSNKKVSPFYNIYIATLRQSNESNHLNRQTLVKT